MNRSLIALAMCAFIVGCDDDNTTSTSPSGLPVVLSAVLRPANEVPPVGNAESVGTGAVQITMNLTRDAAGGLTGATADVYFQLLGFPDTSVVGAHIHPGVAGLNVPVIVGTQL